jgi:hypothetical protein
VPKIGKVADVNSGFKKTHHQLGSLPK